MNGREESCDTYSIAHSRCEASSVTVVESWMLPCYEDFGSGNESLHNC